MAVINQPAAFFLGFSASRYGYAAICASAASLWLSTRTLAFAIDTPNLRSCSIRESSTTGAEQASEACSGSEGCALLSVLETSLLPGLAKVRNSAVALLPGV